MKRVANVAAFFRFIQCSGVTFFNLETLLRYTNQLKKKLMLPSKFQIELWTDKKLMEVVESGESLNWNIRLTETESEIEYYVESLYSEMDKRNLTIKQLAK